MKRCPRCEKLHPDHDFYRGRDGKLAAYCISCQRERWLERKPALTPEQREAKRLRSLAWYRKHAKSANALRTRRRKCGRK